MGFGDLTPNANVRASRRFGRRSAGSSIAIKIRTCSSEFQLRRRSLSMIHVTRPMLCSEPRTIQL
jgi:hypothetical protein